MPHDVIMPALGMAQDTGLIVSWLKKPGDAVKTGEALMEVETDKAVMEVEAAGDGFLAAVSAQAGDHVPVGQVVAVIAETAEAAKNTSPSPSDTKPQDAKPTSPEAAKPEALPSGAEIIMPALGMAQDSGLIVAWRKKPGDPVATGDILLEVETDKSVMEVEAGHDGFLAAILADARQAVPVGSVIAIISAEKPENAVARSHKSTAADDNGAPGKPAPKAPPAAAKIPQTGGAAASGGRILASPKTRRLAMEKGLDLSLLVEHGVPQPYHVSDLRLLETLVSSTKAADASPSPASAGALPMHIGARVAASGCDEFIAWLAKDGDIHVEPRLIWLRFATAAFREATGLRDKTLVVESRTVRTTDGRFADADRSRLSKPLSDAGDQVPSIMMRDLSGSPITAATGIPTHAPVLTVCREREDYVVSLDYQAGQLDEDQAIEFVTGFVDRLGEPLRHLL
ncbi:Pyruvate/2-oxoglutarate dehydrogenase complex [Hoeflea phototrophica DFL-43]|uniref:Pyruvate/2-oxoglutarate dehydrogenase complex n=1 Tax=Hoeflea phototrophica (strain DSM 17068 / NCIMB 14078 / DFL-43) TaxID=411684 RepID=A9D7L4_HOEPD|nr:biotin/lipoyl-containing protein [Hoeflea phototrophica]EDQ33101.1 Pyruvate/2-oxoglutarate dehydrogenase complex [Hoeflea phototrophica DFL-43]